MTRAALGLAAVAALAACRRRAAPAKQAPVPVMSPVEIARSKDACKVYVERVCACAALQPALAPQCRLARMLPDAVKLAAEVAANPDTKRHDVRGAQHSVRVTAKECIEETAKLPTLGCPEGMPHVQAGAAPRGHAGAAPHGHAGAAPHEHAGAAPHGHAGAAPHEHAGAAPHGHAGAAPGGHAGRATR